MFKNNSRSARGSKRRKDAQRAGFRSAFEWDISKAAKAAGIKYDYESIEIEWEVPAQEKVYTPDFILTNGVIVESKGRLTKFDREKHLRIQEQHPELDIRFVFQCDNPINRGSKTRYSDWCKKNNFKYAFKVIPKEWAEEEVKEIPYGN